MSAKTQILGSFFIEGIHFLWGYGVGFTSPCLPKIEETHQLSEGEISWFASILVVGQLIGCMVGPILSDNIGRKPCLTISHIIAAIGWLVMVLTPDEAGNLFLTLLMTGRFLHGFGEANGTPASLIYISELSSVKMRGALINSISIASGTGMAVAYTVGYFMSWRMVIWIAIGMHVFFMIGLLFIPESPVYLASVKREEKARTSLKWYRHQKENSSVQKEYEEILLNLSNKTENENDSEDKNDIGKSFISKLKCKYLIMTKPHVLRPLLILVTLFLLFPIMGIYSITFYAINIFIKIGIGSKDVVAIFTACVRVLGTIFATCFIHKYGRRKVLLCSAILVTISIIIVTSIVFTQEKMTEGIKDAFEIALVLFLLNYTFFMGLGIMTIPWIYMAEWPPAEVKGLTTGSCIFTSNVFIFIVVKLTPILESSIGLPWLFAGYSFICIVNFVFTFFLVPETNGKTYESQMKRTVIEESEEA